MREILFRAKSIIADSPDMPDYWLYGSLIKGTRFCDEYTWSTYYVINPKNSDVELNEDVEVWPETVGQYSGWNDKKGQKIFEGDIVDIEPHGYIPTMNRGVVIFKDGGFGIEYQTAVARKFGWGKTFHRIGTIGEWRDMGASGTITYTYEVVGNIYDNPELLEVK